MLLSEDATIPLSVDQKPMNVGVLCHDDTQPQEKERIVQAGGIVFNGRVDGDLAVARAFGDFTYKQREDLPPEAQEVSCEPEIRIRERKETDRMLVLACDGVWDVWRDLDAFRTELFEYIVEFNKRTDLEKGSEAGGCPECLPGPVFGARQHRQYEPIGDTTRQLEMFLNKQAKHARASTSSATASASSYPSLRPQPWSSCSR